MSRVTFLVLATVALTALAGCSKDPPSGALGAGTLGVAMQSGDLSTNTYTEEERPAGDVPVIGPDLCPPPQAPSQVPRCVDASSHFDIHVMALPQPDAEGYKAFLVGAAGEMELGIVEPDAQNMWRLNRTLDDDVSGNYTSIEIRMGAFVLATASAAAGAQTFSLAPGLDAIGATGTYSGKVLNVTVSGLPAAGEFVGRLYTYDEASQLVSVAETFPVRNGANEFTAPLDIADYAEFHIHAGASLINLYKAPIGERSLAPAAGSSGTATAGTM